MPVCGLHNDVVVDVDNTAHSTPSEITTKTCQERRLRIYRCHVVYIHNQQHYGYMHRISCWNKIKNKLNYVKLTFIPENLTYIH